jgi:diaminohydroxyphosphoribosylaminopyrimidine deaminase/5-amino-6-(5-phosphoribosylamino)uracil reductase
MRDGKVVGEGWHERAGEPHAEPRALAMAGEAARGATAYVTL